MANVRIQPSRALTVYKSDDADIPFPAIAATGTADGTGANELIDSTVDFLALSIYPGNIVYNLNTLFAATVTEVPTATPSKLVLNANIFTSGDKYAIYQSSPMAGGQNTGCVLYVGTGGDVVVTMAGQDEVTFFNIQDGTFMPVQVIKVWSATTAENIIALW
jgi:hypothetical protein